MRTNVCTGISMPRPLVEWLRKEALAWGKNPSSYVVWLLERERDMQLAERVLRLEKTIDEADRRGGKP